MRLFGKTVVIAGALALISACGGSDAGEAGPPKPIEKQPAAPATSTSAAAETPTPAPVAAEKEPSAEFADLPEPYKSADYARGKRVFRTCSSCHLIDPDAGNLVGPNLHGMFSREAGSLESFGSYSKALKDVNFTWSAAELEDWLANPRTYLPGNNMSFSGVRKQPDRDAVIAYLMVETAK